MRGLIIGLVLFGAVSFSSVCCFGQCMTPDCKKYKKLEAQLQTLKQEQKETCEKLAAGKERVDCETKFTAEKITPVVDEMNQVFEENRLGLIMCTILDPAAKYCGQDMSDPRAFGSGGEKSDCAELYKYQVRFLDDAWDKERDKYLISNLDKEEFEAMGGVGGLDEDVWYYDEWSETTNSVASILKETAEQIAKLLKLDPVTGAVSGSVGTGTVTASEVLKEIDSGKRIDAIANAEIVKAVAKQFLDSVGPVGKQLQAIWQLQDDINEMKYSKAQRDELKKITKQQVEALDASIAKYEEQMAQPDEEIRTMKAIKEAVDTHCHPNH